LIVLAHEIWIHQNNRHAGTAQEDSDRSALSRLRGSEAFLDGVLCQLCHVIDVQLVHDAQAVCLSGLDRKSVV
jgi:hypothetical protein